MASINANGVVISSRSSSSSGSSVTFDGDASSLAFMDAEAVLQHDTDAGLSDLETQEEGRGGSLISDETGGFHTSLPALDDTCSMDDDSSDPPLEVDPSFLLARRCSRLNNIARSFYLDDDESKLSQLLQQQQEAYLEDPEVAEAENKKEPPSGLNRAEENSVPTSESHSGGGEEEGSNENVNNRDADEETIFFTHDASPDSKNKSYPCLVDPSQEDRAVEIPLFSIARPHMRAFHIAWLAFFVAFFTWFAMTPLLSEIMVSLDLTHDQIWISSILAVASSALTRTFVGPLNDKYGARWVMALTLVAAAIPTGLAGWLLHSATSLYILRFFIGVAGSSFVTCQYWTTIVFAPEVAGTANALAAGWGNLGGGIAQVVMGSLLFPLFRYIYGGPGFSTAHEEVDEGEHMEPCQPCELAWRTILVFPALMCLAMAISVLLFSDDTPKGNIRERRTQNLVEPVSAVLSLRHAAASANTWLLSIQYGCCFGVEITMTQAAALYFKEEFGQSTESAAAIASVFGWMNLFARGIGGFCSDIANAKSGMRGRLIFQVVFLLIEGLFVIIFSMTQSLAGAIIVMVLFSIAVQAAEGTTFGIVPYVAPSVTGSIAGLVGAGGNVGGVAFGLLFWGLDYRSAFLFMGCFVMASAVCAVFIHIPGHRGLFSGQDSPEVTAHRRSAKLPSEITVDIDTAPIYMNDDDEVDDFNMSATNFAR